MSFAAVVLILAQRVHIGGPSADSPIFTLTVETVDRTGGSMPFVKVVLAKIAQDGSQIVVAETEVDRQSRAQFSKLPPGNYLLIAKLGGFIETRVGPIQLNGDTIIPSPLRLMMNEWGVY
jgi:hypothetical protein